MNEDLKQRIADELNVDPAELAGDTVLEESEYWDSVTVLTMMFIIGDAVGKEITPDDMANLRTFGDIEKLVESKIG
ncbi:MAG: acyl carrier protein [Pirellulales bacterium]|nr:acyl carrier protein [Pirellulales bacterium]